MAKIFSVTPAELDILNDRNANNHNHLDSSSDTSYPSTPTDTHSSDPFASHFRPLKSTSTSASTVRGGDLSKIVLSFFLSPTGYRLLRLDTKSKSKKGKSTATPVNSSSASKKSKKVSATVSHKSLQRLGTSLVDPEEYEQWFKSQAYNDNNKLSIDDGHHGDNDNKRQVNRNVAALSSATRAGIRGFTLAFLAGTAMDVLLPALLKQKFRGLVRKIFTNPSSLRLGASCGLFAFVYKLSFHLIALALESYSSQDQRTSTSRRSDSGIGLGDRQRRGRHGNGKIVFEGLTQLDSEDDENQLYSESDDDTLPVCPKEQIARNRKKWVPALLASLLAAPVYSLIPEKARRLTMALYFLTYAGESAYVTLEHEGLLKWLPSWVGIWVLAPISTSQIVHTFIQHNDCSPVGWTKLIMSQCAPFLHRPKGFDTKTLGAFPTSGQLFEGAKAYMNVGYQSQPILASAATAAAAVLTGDGSVKRFLLPEACESVFRFTESMGHHSVGCQMFHPEDASCGTATKKLLGRNAVFSFKMYAVLAALTFVARGGNVFQKGVMNYVSKTTIATLRSTIATWGIVVTAFPLFCSMDRTLPSWFLPTKRHYINGFLGGLWVLIETPARQSALTLYFTRFMIEALWRRAVKAGWARKVKGGETILFGCAMAVVMGVFETTPSMTRKTIIQSMLNKIFVD
ncbi:hypothetical protein BGZ47_007599 [Haplosporangium gracile]|nr:hypothetical protein BGZ47_007599 [Haplosporangium gracile]